MFAAELHRDQVRKGTSIPYGSHLLGVASLALDTAPPRMKPSPRSYTMRSKIKAARRRESRFGAAPVLDELERVVAE